MTPLAALVGRSPHPPAVDWRTLTIQIGEHLVRLPRKQFVTFLALRAGTPVTSHELAELLHLPRPRHEKAATTARWRVVYLRRRLREATGRDDLIETTQFGYRLVEGVA